MAHRVIVMQKGDVVEQGSADEIFDAQQDIEDDDIEDDLDDEDYEDDDIEVDLDDEDLDDDDTADNKSSGKAGAKARR